MVDIFDPACELLPLYSTFSLTSFPLPFSKKKMYSIYRQLWDGGGGGGVELYCRPYSSEVLHSVSVSDQIQNQLNCFTSPKKNSKDDIKGFEYVKFLRPW